MDDKEYLKERREQANREANPSGPSSTIPPVRAEMTGTVTNPSDKGSPSAASDAGEGAEDLPDTEAGSAGSGLRNDPGASFGGEAHSEAPLGRNRTTRETGEHRQE